MIINGLVRIKWLVGIFKPQTKPNMGLKKILKPSDQIQIANPIRLTN